MNFGGSRVVQNEDILRLAEKLSLTQKYEEQKGRIKPFSLFIKDKGGGVFEEQYIYSLETELGYVGKIDRSLFLTGTLLRCVYPLAGNHALPPTVNLMEALHNFYEELTGDSFIWDSYISDNKMFRWYKNPNPFADFNTFDYQYTMLGIEIYNLIEAILYWLDPLAAKDGFLPVSKLFNQPLSYFSEPEVKRIFQYRFEELSYSPGSFKNGKFTTIIKSPGLLPLCWAEIWYAVEHDIKASICPICGDTYIFLKQNNRKATCGRPECLHPYNILRSGGIEAYRRKEAERKRSQRGSLPGRKPGRPPKK